MKYIYEMSMFMISRAKLKIKFYHLQYKIWGKHENIKPMDQTNNKNEIIYIM